MLVFKQLFTFFKVQCSIELSGDGLARGEVFEEIAPPQRGQAEGGHPREQPALLHL
jgi:hypothetical protein